MGSRIMAAAFGALISLNALGQVQLVIGDNGTTLVQKTYTRELAVGKVEMRLESLPAQTIPESVTLSETSGTAPAKVLSQRLTCKEKPGGPADDMGLSYTLDSPADGPRTFTLSYLVRGQTWQSEYNAFLAPDRTSVRFEGWISLSNQTSGQYSSPRITLARSAPDAAAQYPPERSSSASGFIESSLMPLEGVETLDPFSTMRVPLLNTPQIAITPFLECETAGRAYREECMYSDHMPPAPSVWWWVELGNTPENGMGKVLQKGSIRVFQQTAQGMILLNTGTLDTAQPAQKMRIRIAPEPGITVKKQVKQPGDGLKQDGSGGRNMVQSISLTSTLDAPREVRVFDRPESVRRGTAVSDASDLYKTLDDGRMEFRVEVTPGTERIITYTTAM